MSVINTNTQSAAARTQSQEVLGRSLNRLSTNSKLAAANNEGGNGAISEKLNARSLGLQAASSSVQGGISYVQTADSFLSSITSTLSRMSELAAQAKQTGDAAPFQKEFTQLQEQLRATIGGSAGEIGGSGVSAPTGTFDGAALFGANPAGKAIPAGNQDVTIKETNLRSGAMAGLIQQDAGGIYALSLTSGDVGKAIAGAASQVALQRNALGESQMFLQHASAKIQIESENLSSAFARIGDANTANTSTQFAKFNILGQTAAALQAQANHTPQSVLKVLQG